MNKPYSQLQEGMSAYHQRLAIIRAKVEMRKMAEQDTNHTYAALLAQELADEIPWLLDACTRCVCKDCPRGDQQGEERSLKCLLS